MTFPSYIVPYKSRMQNINFFPFQWNYDDEFDHFTNSFRCVIRIWGWNELNEGVCVRVNNFKIPIWIELPSSVDGIPVQWSDQNLGVVEKWLMAKMWIRADKYEWPKKGVDLNTVPDVFTERNKAYYTPSFVNVDIRHKLYNNSFIKCTDGSYKSKEFSWFHVAFSNQKAINKLAKALAVPVKIDGIGEKVQLSVHCASKNLTPVMKLMAVRQLPSSNWIFAQGFSVSGDRKESNKQHEYQVPSEKLIAHPHASSLPIVHPLVCSWDIETHSYDHLHFPDPEEPKDVLLQIACVFARKGQVTKKVCLTLGKPLKPSKEQLVEMSQEERDGWDFKMKCYDNEADLLMAFKRTILREDPDVLIGYNIFGFDIRYLVVRAGADQRQIWTEWSKFGCLKDRQAQSLTIEWESSARGKVNMHFLNAHGRLFIDLLPVIRASENLPSYSLQAVASKHLKTNKDDIKPQEIFRSWTEQDMDTFGKVAKYAVQDTYVTYLLYEKLLIWLGLVESATTNKVPIFSMVTSGQQIKAYAQVFDYCLHNRLVCNVPPRSRKNPYMGAIVTEPIAGLYKMILPFDFASLYPSIIMAHNIDFSRFVSLDDTTVSNDDCWIVEGSDHKDCGCPKDPVPKKETKQRFRKDGTEIVAKNKKIVCSEYTYRFLKQDKGGSGVVPTIIKNLLDARKTVRNEIASLEERIEMLGSALHPTKEDAIEIQRLYEIIAVLDKRQLAYKVNANSMYGMYGAETGYLPFFAGAESVTNIGRKSIMAASRYIESAYGGKVVYNDTDSAYCYFDSMKDKTIPEIWKFAEDVVEDIKKLFEKPMKLEFEGKVYVKFMIFTKKKYVAQPADENGKVKDKLYMRGVPLVRREYVENFKTVYSNCVNFILANTDAILAIPRDKLVKSVYYQQYIQIIFDNFLAVLHRTMPLKQFVVYKGLTKETYANPQAHAAVAQKLRARGTPVAVNSRIEYIMLAEPDGIYDKDKKQYTCSEDLTYFKEFQDILRLDYHGYFVSQYINYLDQMTETIFGVQKPVKRMVWYTAKKNWTKGGGGGGSFLDKNRCLDELQARMKPKIFKTETSGETDVNRTGYNTEFLYRIQAIEEQRKRKFREIEFNELPPEKKEKKTRIVIIE